jgi:hypothetical protein
MTPEVWPDSTPATPSALMLYGLRQQWLSYSPAARTPFPEFSAAMAVTGMENKSTSRALTANVIFDLRTELPPSEFLIERHDCAHRLFRHHSLPSIQRMKVH